MPTAIFLCFAISAGLFILSLIFKVAGKTRLTLPLLYFLAAVVSTFFTDWTTRNEKWVLLGLYVLIGLVVISWIVSFIKVLKQKRRNYYEEDFIGWQIRKAREMGVPLDRVTFDDNNNLIDPRTGNPVDYSAG